ncbi:MAG: cell division protein ZapE, partial [Pseudomonadota bacterium]
GGDLDYRKRCLEGAPVYFAPVGPEAEAAIDAHWAKLTAGAAPRPDAIPVGGRTVTAPLAALGAARFASEDLIAEALGAADYLAIAERYHTVFVDRIPLMGPENRNEAKRFVTFIDALYERRTDLVATAEAEPEALYVAGTGAFEFERAASRLIEMQSAQYRDQPHRTEAGG